MEMTVGQVAERSNVKVSALHFYEQKGLIQSWRNAGNQRRYDRSVLRRIAVIKTAQQLGMSLEEIGEALSHLPVDHAPTQEEWQVMASVWRQQLDERIAKLQKLRDSLGDCIGCGCLSLSRCQLRNPDDALADEGNGAVLL
ncbi:redox-sensitive transcriptional activator SoxR [Photobacterium halotolerans]|uniref:Redox-sensitive transcriptional activator SoxR n=1 Tax=Photobacterium halotolerans TaxID=265726 RepID=A0A7X5AQ80_9GAMM|nr:redox-sensitive transcriptional activator SoxR [Photobacterium halotolerans]NAW63754.1 redox-sensitive transcriptional activator SoxR [Photobacterium halotolerans]NAW86963.1 redox-sensitive transcriptional activator SoxR [Photobacterium halotolerans]